jgi:hypothetical protein
MRFHARIDYPQRGYLKCLSRIYCFFNFLTINWIFKPNKGVTLNTTIRPLTLQERQRPAQMLYVGGFRNASFQIGKLEVPQSSDENMNATAANIVRASIKKSETISFPVFINRNLNINKGYSNTVACVFGQQNNQNGFDAVLVARHNERLSSFNTKLRTVESLLLSQEAQLAYQKDQEARLGKSANARVHNQVMLTGVVVAAQFEDGAEPRYHLYLRQDADPSNIIPLAYEGKNASALVGHHSYGSFVSVTGEYAYRVLPVFKTDDDGKLLRDENRRHIPMMDANGNPLTRVHTYIRILPPRDPAEYDTNFPNGMPPWISGIAEQMAKNRRQTREAMAAAAQRKLAQSSGEEDSKASSLLSAEAL